MAVTTKEFEETLAAQVTLYYCASTEAAASSSTIRVSCYEADFKYQMGHRGARVLFGLNSSYKTNAAKFPFS